VNEIFDPPQTGVWRLLDGLKQLGLAGVTETQLRQVIADSCPDGYQSGFYIYVNASAGEIMARMRSWLGCRQRRLL